MQQSLSFTDLEWSILQTVAYADIFDYPLTAAEIQRYLYRSTASQQEIQAALSSARLRDSYLVERGGYFCLPGKVESISTRQRRAAAAHSTWPVARHYGQLIGRLPFVRMVAVTGSLAVDNVEPGSDIDFLIVTVPQRLWLCRLIVIGMVKLAERRGHSLCPNYFISENALVITDRNLFTARELAQMVPVAGFDTYQTMRRLNLWADDYLPNASEHPQVQAGPDQPIRLGKRIAERILQTPLGTWLENWEMRRKIRKLMRQNSGEQEAAFSADWCKGHFDGHRERILNAYNERLHSLSHTQPTEETL